MEKMLLLHKYEIKMHTSLHVQIVTKFTVLCSFHFFLDLHISGLSHS